MLIPKELLFQIARHSQENYPAECCGLLTGPCNPSGKIEKVITCRNVQDEYHRRDPAQFPRSSREGYFMDPEELLKIEKETRLKGEKIKGIYHSHIDTTAYFSQEDKRQALFENEPVYPDVLYAVIAVKAGKAAEYRVFLWDSKQKDFQEKEAGVFSSNGPLSVQ